MVNKKDLQLSKIDVNKNLISSVFIDKTHPFDMLSHKNVAAILLMSISDAIIKESDSFNHLLVLLSENHHLLEKKLRPLATESFWKVLQDIDFNEVICTINKLEKLGVSFTSPPIKTGFVRIDPSLYNFKGENLRENSEQKRIISKIHIIEDIQKINIQGVAGSGKTTVLFNAADLLINTLPSAKIIWLSNSYELTRTVNHKYNDKKNLVAATYYEFCEHLINPFLTWNDKYQLKVDENLLMNKLELVGKSDRVKRYDFKLILQTVENFCLSSSSSFNDRMVPSSCDAYKRSIILEYAKKHWSLIRNRKIKDFPVKRIHHIKYVQTRVKDIKNFSFNIMLIDEAQDICPSMLYIVKCLTGQYKSCQHHNTQAIMFGDRFQSTSYFNEWGYEFDKKRKIFNPKYDEKVELLNDSERLSDEASGIITNTLISGGHSANEIAFKGINPTKTEILSCSWSDLENGIGIMKNKTLFLVEDVWSALFAAQVLTNKRIPIYIPTDTANEIRDITLSALDFIDQQIITNPEFSGYKNWNAYVNAKAKDVIVMERIDSMFNKGYKQEHLEITLNKAGYSNKKHLISLMKYAKGMECEQVYVLPNIRKQQALFGDTTISMKESNELYVALTRSTGKLFLPDF